MSDHKKHLLIMAVCCLAPVAAIFAIGALGITTRGFASVLPFFLFLLCPIVMFLGMGLLMRNSGHHHSPPTQATTASSRDAQETGPTR